VSVYSVEVGNITLKEEGQKTGLERENQARKALLCHINLSGETYREGNRDENFQSGDLAIEFNEEIRLALGMTTKGFRGVNEGKAEDRDRTLKKKGMDEPLLGGPTSNRDKEK